MPIQHIVQSLKAASSAISSKKSTVVKAMLQEIHNKPEYKAKVYDTENQKRLKVVFKTRLGRWSTHDKGKVKIKKLYQTLEEKIAYWGGKINECSVAKANLERKPSKLERLLLALVVFCTSTLLGRRSFFKEKQQESLTVIEETVQNMESLKSYLKNLSNALHGALPAAFWTPYDDEEYASVLSEVLEEQQKDMLYAMIQDIESFVEFNTTGESRKSLEEELRELLHGMLSNGKEEKVQMVEQIEDKRAVEVEENKVEVEENRETLKEIGKVEMLETPEEIENIQKKVNEEAQRVVRVEDIVVEHVEQQVFTPPLHLDVTSKEPALATSVPETGEYRNAPSSDTISREVFVNAFTTPAHVKETKPQEAHGHHHHGAHEHHHHGADSHHHHKKKDAHKGTGCGSGCKCGSKRR